MKSPSHDEIAGLPDRSTQELTRAWRRGCHHTGPPLGLSRDLIIRGLADKRQQRAHGGPSRALQRRLRILAEEFEKGAGFFDAGGVLKTGARAWCGGGAGTPIPSSSARTGSNTTASAIGRSP